MDCAVVIVVVRVTDLAGGLWLDESPSDLGALRPCEMGVLLPYINALGGR